MAFDQGWFDSALGSTPRIYNSKTRAIPLSLELHHPQRRPFGATVGLKLTTQVHTACADVELHSFRIFVCR
jgi:hypothetical protein